MPYFIITQEPDGTEGRSSPLTQTQAIAFAQAHLEIGVPVKRIETSEGEVIEGDELGELLKHGTPQK